MHESFHADDAAGVHHRPADARHQPDREAVGDVQVELELLEVEVRHLQVGLEVLLRGREHAAVAGGSAAQESQAVKSSIMIA